MKQRMVTYFEKEFVTGVPAAKLIGFYLLGVEFEKTAKRDKDQDILNAIKSDSILIEFSYNESKLFSVLIINMNYILKS